VTSAKTVESAEHGAQEETFVCQHLAMSLRTRRRVGFFWASNSKARPDAWCRECNDRARATGGKWVGEAGAELGVKLICASCYDDLRALNPTEPAKAGDH
jgi:hypothetical protein